MNKGQKWLLALLIIAPTIVGLVLVGLRSRTTERTILPAAVGKRIGLVRISDVIYSSEFYVQQLKEYRTDNSVAGVVLRVNSPGGTVSPAQEIYREILRFRDAGKPLVVSMDNIAASGGYYLSAAADKIFANPGTLTGSFGVIMRFPEVSELSKKVGIKMNTIKAGEFKDIASAHREMTPRDRELLQSLLDDTHDQFVGHIAAGRGIPIDSVRKLADGRVFTGRQAYHLGLVDTLGGIEEAISYLKTRLDLPERTKIVEKGQDKSWLQEVFSETKLGNFGIFRNLSNPPGLYFLLDYY